MKIGEDFTINPGVDIRGGGFDMTQRCGSRLVEFVGFLGEERTQFYFAVTRTQKILSRRANLQPIAIHKSSLIHRENIV